MESHIQRILSQLGVTSGSVQAFSFVPCIGKVVIVLQEGASLPSPEVVAGAACSAEWDVELIPEPEYSRVMERAVRALSKIDEIGLELAKRLVQVGSYSVMEVWALDATELARIGNIDKGRANRILDRLNKVICEATED